MTPLARHAFSLQTLFMGNEMTIVTLADGREFEFFCAYRAAEFASKHAGSTTHRSVR